MSDFYDRNPPAREFRGRLIEMRSQEELLRGAFHYMKDWRKLRGMQLWCLVGWITGHGSGYSQQICEELGWQYDMKITPNAQLPPRRPQCTRPDCRFGYVTHDTEHGPHHVACPRCFPDEAVANGYVGPDLTS